MPGLRNLEFVGESTEAKEGEWERTQMKARRTAEAFPVIEYIHDELKARHWNMWQLALRMGGNPQINKLSMEILEADPCVLIGDEGAKGLARAFGTSQQVWLNLERSWRAFYERCPVCGNAIHTVDLVTPRDRAGK